jgi:murein L,D-transpeptidase YafK
MTAGKAIIAIAIAALLVACAPSGRTMVRWSVATITQRARRKHTVSDRMAQFGPTVRRRLSRDFARIGAAYPPKRVIFVGLKQERLLEVWVGDPPQLVKTYPILGASGTLGPKLREGDRQVPEGLYRIASLNPNSKYHLALRVNYPNRVDKRQARREGRKGLGGAIMIHGKTCSAGCLAMGDEAAEDLFVLAAATGTDNVTVILSPVDFRTRRLPKDLTSVAEWTTNLHASIERALNDLRQYGEVGLVQ